MNCATIKEGVFCHLMSKSGCNFNAGECQTIVEQCKGCDKITSYTKGEYCNSFPNPAIKWEWIRCNFASHVKADKNIEKKVNPLKASKRASGR